MFNQSEKISKISQEGFFLAHWKIKRKPDILILIKYQFSQSLQPPNLENQSNFNLKQELIQQKPIKQAINLVSFPKPQASNYMKNKKKTMQNQKNDGLLIIERLMKSIRILQEEIKILKQEKKIVRQKLKTEQRLIKQQIEVKYLEEKIINYQIQENKMKIKVDRQLGNQYEKDYQKMLSVIIKISNIQETQDIKRKVEEKQKEIRKEIEDQMQARMEEYSGGESFKRGSENHKNLINLHFIKPPEINSGWPY